MVAVLFVSDFDVVEIAANAALLASARGRATGAFHFDCGRHTQTITRERDTRDDRSIDAPHCTRGRGGTEASENKRINRLQEE
jgi:hypothetical protein